MPKILMTDGPMSGRVVDVKSDHEAAEVLDRGLGVIEDGGPPAKKKGVRRVAAVRRKRADERADERADVDLETPEA